MAGRLLATLAPLGFVLTAVLATGARAQVFGPETIVSSSAVGANCLIAADVDGDGLVDLVGTEYINDRAVWFRQLSPGVYSSAKLIGKSLDGAWHCRAVDFDGDMDIDVVTTAAPSNSVTVFENLGGGASWATHLLTSSALDAGGLAVTDLDLDGDIDILAASDLDSKLRLFMNRGSMQFDTVEIGVAAAWAVTAADFDADGDPDVVVGGYSSDTLFMLENQGGGQLGPPMSFASLNGPSSLRGHDINGDGLLDLLVASRVDSKVSWFAGDGAGNFGPIHLLSTTLVTPYQADAVDIDDDGDLDVFVAASGSNQIAWFEATGGGQFSAKKTLSFTASGARYIAIADLDGDGDFDLTTATNGDNSFSIYQNILPLKKPKLFTLTGLHSIDAGQVQLTGENLLETTVRIDGVPAVIQSGTETQMTLALPVDEPGGLRDVVLENPFGATEWPAALARYPALTLPATAALGEAVQLVIDNGDVGGYVLAVSGALFAAPAPFEAFGWYYGLELNGVWILASGLFTPGATQKSLPMPAIIDPSLVGVPFYFQAWTSQATLGYAGFTGVGTIVVE
jgi:hypothetical protein